MAKVEHRGIVYDSLADVPGITRIRKPRSFVGELSRGEREAPQFTLKQFDSLSFLIYRGATLPPSHETYHHARNIALVIAEMARNPNQPKPIMVADIGTGTGIIATTIAHSLPTETQGENPLVRVVGTDISGRALEVAELNAQANDTPQVVFRKRDLLEGLVAEFGKIDVVISNPPFSATGQINPRYLRSDYIPLLALDGGDDGVSVHRKLLEQARTVLSDTGVVFFEQMSFRTQRVTQLAQEIIPAAGVLAIRGSIQRYTATAVGNPDTLEIVKRYSGGKLIA